MSEKKSIGVLYRLEPGCLGPTGDEHVVPFCELVNKAMPSLHKGTINFQVEPRLDKSAPEISYTFNNKLLSTAQAESCLKALALELGDFEDELHDKMTHLTGQYLARL